MIVMNINKIQDIYNDNLRFMGLVLNSTYDVIGKGQDLWIDLLRPTKSSTRVVRRDNQGETVEGIQSKGDRFLSELNVLSKADQSKGFDMYEIGERIGFEEFETEEIVNNLSRAELINRDKSSDNVFITPYGIMINNRDIIVGYAPVH
jgi:hypothetical protein